eukprot:scaffold86299_cov69-Phaeocystis_antarctica.AAC.2
MASSGGPASTRRNRRSRLRQAEQGGKLWCWLARWRDGTGAWFAWRLRWRQRRRWRWRRFVSDRRGPMTFRSLG